MPATIDLSKFHGANAYERAMAYVRTQPWGKALSYESAFLRARDIVRQNGEATFFIVPDRPGGRPVSLAEALPSSPSSTPDPDAEPVLDLRRAPGVNKYERATFVLGTELGESFISLPHEEKFRLVSTALKTREVVE